MALPKQVKKQGSYYQGFTLAVSTTVKAYTAVIVNTDKNYVLNSISLVPNVFGSGETMTVRQFDDIYGTGTCLAILAEDIPNMGAQMPINFDFPALQEVNKTECIAITYTGSGTALTLYGIAEFAGITKTS